MMIKSTKKIMTSVEHHVTGFCCDHPNYGYINGQEVCLNCGLVKGTQIVSVSKRAFGEEDRMRKIHHESDTTPAGISYKTYFSNLRDGNGNHLTPEAKTLYYRLSKINGSNTTSLERNLTMAFPRLKSMSRLLNLPESVLDTAWQIYRVVAEKKLTAGRSIEAFITASLYCSTRALKITRLMDDFMGLISVSKKKATKAIRIINREILPLLGLKYELLSANDLIFYFGNLLGIPFEYQRKAVQLLSSKRMNFSGKDPKGIAAGALYCVLKRTPEERTQAELSEMAKVTEVTLRSRIKELS